MSVVFNVPRQASIRSLQFCAEKLISLDSKNDICIFSLQMRKLLTSYAPPGHVTTLVTDPTLDYMLIGMQTGGSESKALKVT